MPRMEIPEVVRFRVVAGQARAAGQPELRSARCDSQPRGPSRYPMAQQFGSVLAVESAVWYGAGFGGRIEMVFFGDAGLHRACGGRVISWRSGKGTGGR